MRRVKQMIMRRVKTPLMKRNIMENLRYVWDAEEREQQ